MFVFARVKHSAYVHMYMSKANGGRCEIVVDVATANSAVTGGEQGQKD